MLKIIIIKPQICVRRGETIERFVVGGVGGKEEYVQNRLCEILKDLIKNEIVFKTYGTLSLMIWMLDLMQIYTNIIYLWPERRGG